MPMPLKKCRQKTGLFMVCDAFGRFLPQFIRQKSESVNVKIHGTIIAQTQQLATSGNSTGDNVYHGYSSGIGVEPLDRL